jgi:NAD(P)H-hydrate epimerase
MIQRLLVSAKTSADIDALAKGWGFDEYALVEAAGRLAADNFSRAYPDFFPVDKLSGGCRFRITAVAGAGNNGADSLVMIRAWLLSQKILPSFITVVMCGAPQPSERSPVSQLVKSLQKMNIKTLVWDDDEKAAKNAISGAGLIIDGIAGTGIRGPLAGTPEKMASAINSLKEKQGGNKPPFVVSVDLPSGNSDGWKPGMPIVKADATLSIEPEKYCLYKPKARPFAGNIIPVGGVFPSNLVSSFEGAELLDWDYAKKLIPAIEPDAYKHERGSVEIRAGAEGTTGAAVIAAIGAQSCGAGLVRLVLDDGIYPVLASSLGSSNPGIMVYPVSKSETPPCDAVLLGPGWGKAADRKMFFEKALAEEKKGSALILDADALSLAGGSVFNNRCIMTPHPGEFAALTGTNIDELLTDPVPLLIKTSKEKKAVIILKGHVINIASPDGRWGIIDGMVPVLASGGSGDLLAGFCAAIAARMSRQAVFDAYTCASAAAALLIAAGRSEEAQLKFTDPKEIAAKAASLAGRCWLSKCF